MAPRSTVKTCEDLEGVQLVVVALPVVGHHGGLPVSAISQYNSRYNSYPGDLTNTVWLDAEYNMGWNEVLADSSGSCGSVVSVSACCSTSIDRATFDGFTDTISNNGMHRAVFSSYDFWNNTTFACGSCTSGNGYIPHTYEWTYGTDGSNGPADPPVSPAPGESGASSGWCQYLSGKNSCASFFGGQSTSSSYAYMWQWSEYGLGNNSINDFDQFDEARMGYS